MLAIRYLPISGNRCSYHALYMEDEKPNEDDEAYFQRTADGFQDQFKGIVNKYQLLMMKESMVSVCDPSNDSSIYRCVFV